jgi:hypothetical protein
MSKQHVDLEDRFLDDDDLSAHEPGYTPDEVRRLADFSRTAEERHLEVARILARHYPDQLKMHPHARYFQRLLARYGMGDDNQQ